jgi:hypothetical protein
MWFEMSCFPTRNVLARVPFSLRPILEVRINIQVQGCREVHALRLGWRTFFKHWLVLGGQLLFPLQ